MAATSSGAISRPKMLVAQHVQLGAAVAAGPLAPGADARVRRVVDHRQQRAEAGALLDLLLVSDSAPMVRPWKAPSKAISPDRWVWWRASLIAPSTASVPELVRKTRAFSSNGAIDASALHELEVARLVEVGGGDVDQPIGLLLDRRDDRRVAVAGAGHGDAGGEVEEAVAVDIGDDVAARRSRRRAGRRGSGWAGDGVVAGDDRAGTSARAAR